LPAFLRACLAADVARARPFLQNRLDGANDGVRRIRMAEMF
jgi:hypothetical protein